MEVKVVLSMSVPGAALLTPEFCEKNSKESYNEHKVIVNDVKGKGKKQKIVKKVLTFKTRKQRLVTHNINLCEEAYHYMLLTPTSPKFLKHVKKSKKNNDTSKRIWDTMSVHERLKEHFDLIAHDFNAVSYSYEILND